MASPVNRHARACGGGGAVDGDVSRRFRGWPPPTIHGVEGGGARGHLVAAATHWTRPAGPGGSPWPTGSFRAGVDVPPTLGCMVSRADIWTSSSRRTLRRCAAGSNLAAKKAVRGVPEAV